LYIPDRALYIPDRASPRIWETTAATWPSSSRWPNGFTPPPASSRSMPDAARSATGGCPGACGGPRHRVLYRDRV